MTWGSSDDTWTKARPLRLTNVPATIGFDHSCEKAVPNDRSDIHRTLVHIVQRVGRESLRSTEGNDMTVVASI